METIYLKSNTSRFIPKTKYKTLKNISLPLTITEEIVKDCIPKKDNDHYDYIMRHMFT